MNGSRTRPPPSKIIFPLPSLLLISLTLLVWLVVGVRVNVSPAQVVLDGTTGGSAGQALGTGTLPNGQTLSDGSTMTDHLISHTVGKTINNNLFHSFQDFSIVSGNSATFTGPNTINNVLSRVTGGNPSDIQGKIASTIENANIFLFNPHGVIFGPNATLDLKGAFHVSTADAVGFKKNGSMLNFYADVSLDGTSGSVLHVPSLEAFGFVGDPTTFGFLAENPAGIIIDQSQLRVPETLSVIAGDIKTVGNPEEQTFFREGLQLDASRINLVSVDSPGQVVINGSDIEVDSFERLGNIDLSGNASHPIPSFQRTTPPISVGEIGEGTQTVVVRGGKMMVADNFRLSAKDVDVNVVEDVLVLDGEIVAGNNVRVTAGTLTLKEGGNITSGTGGLRFGELFEGSPGNIEITVGSLHVMEGAQIRTQANPGQAGTIAVNASGEVSLSGADSGIFSLSFGPGGDGAIQLDVEKLTLTERARIDTSTRSESTGQAGSITIKSDDAVTISGDDALSDTGIFSQANGTGNGGPITISTPSLVVGEGGGISALAFGGGLDGDIVLSGGAENPSLLGGEIGGLTSGAIIPDSSLNTGVEFESSSNEFIITGGTENGPNLFHSFNRFTLLPKEIATFSGPSGISNIFSRVTGGTSSVINGLLRSTIDGANLYFLNPDGVLFGAQAQLDLKGSFHVSTATSLVLDGGTRFLTGSMEGSGLTDGTPVAFGFEDNSPATISIRKSMLQVPKEKTFSIAGGNIEIVGIPSHFSAVSNVPVLAAPTGRINLWALDSPHDVPINGGPNVFDGAQQFGGITVRNAGINVSGDTGGRVVIRGGQLEGQGLRILADSNGGSLNPQTGIDLQLTDKVMLTNSNLSSNGNSGGRPGEINVTSLGEIILNHVEISSRSSRLSREGDPDPRVGGGVITVSGKKVSLLASTLTINTEAEAGGGPVGKLKVKADKEVSIIGSSISSESGWTLGGGEIVIEADEVHMTNSRVSSKTTSNGHAGSITVTARDGVLDLKSSFIESDSEPSGQDIGLVPIGGLVPGKPGSITLSGQMVSIGGNTSTIISGNADSTTAFGLLATKGPAGKILIKGERVSITAPADPGSSIRIEANTFGEGQAGSVTIDAKESIDMRAQAQGRGSNNITVGASGLYRGLLIPTGNAGEVILSAPTVTLNATLIRSSTTSGAPAGNILVETDNLTLGEGVRLESISGVRFSIFDTDLPTTASFGNAGSITLQGSDSLPADSVTISGGRLRTSTLHDGAGGEIKIAAKTVTVTDGAEISVASFGKADAGNITLNVETLIVQDAQITSSNTTLPETDSDIRTYSPAIGNAGSLTIQGLSGGNTSAGKIEVINSELRTTAEEGAGGFIQFNANQIDLTNSTISATVRDGTTSDTSPSDNVTLTAPTLNMTGGSIQAETEGSRTAGNINFNVGTLDVTGGATISSSNTGRNLNSMTPQFATGDAGNVTVDAANTVTLTNSEVSSKATGFGKGGQVVIEAGTSMTLSGATVSATVENTKSSENGGDIFLKGGKLVLLKNGTTVSATNDGNGVAGDVVIRGLENIGPVKAGELDKKGEPIHLVNTIRLKDSTVSTNSNSATGGNITLSADFLIDVIDSRIESEIAEGTKGGNIDLDPQFIILQGATLISARSAGGGDGGTVSLGRADTFIITDSAREASSFVDVSSAGGQAGQIIIRAAIQVLSQEATPPKVSFTSVARLFASRCAAQQEGQFSSIVARPPDGLPPAPGDLFPSPLTLDGPGGFLAQAGTGGAPSRLAASTRLGFTEESWDTELPSRSPLLLSSHMPGCSR